MRRFSVIPLVFLAGCLASGCVATHKKDYSWGIKFVNGIEITQAGPDDGATAEVDLKPAVDYILKLREKDAAADPE